MKVGTAVNVKRVNDGYTKGIIVTAETLYGMRKNADVVFGGNKAGKEGYLHLVNFLEEMYDRI